MTLITAERAAEILGVSKNEFNSARKGLGMPDPAVPSRLNKMATGHRGGSTPAMYDEAVIRAYGEGKDVRRLILDYRYKQRNGHSNRARVATKPRAKRREPVQKGAREIELQDRDKKLELPQVGKDFLLGRFAPEPVRVAHSMKMMRAKLNKPTTISVHYPGDGAYREFI